MPRRIILILVCFVFPLMSLFAAEVPTGNKMKPDTAIQRKGVDTEKEFAFVPGDTIIVSKSQTNYLTGERIAKWVYYVRHVVQQVGGKRFPDGVLIRGIYSWVRPEDMLMLSPVERQDSAINAALLKRMSRDKEEIEKRIEEAADLDEDTKSELERRTGQTGTEALPVLAVDSVERAREDSIRRANEYEEEMRLRRLAEEEAEREQLKRTADSLERARVEDSVRHSNQRHAFIYMPQHRFSVGLRGGVASLMQETQNNVMDHWKAGYDALLDLQYAWYAGARNGGKTNLGFITGVSVGYSRSPLAAPFDTAYSVKDIDDIDIDYTITADKVNEKNAQLQLEVPLLFSMRHESGLFLNAGPKVVIPLYAHYNQQITNPNVDAYFPDYDVHVPNEVITGKLEESQCRNAGKWKASTLNVMLTAELGYEWMLGNGNALGLGAYADYSLYDLYNNTPDGKSMINVGLPEPGGAKVSVASATDTYGTGLGFFDCGVKLVYHFCFTR